MSRRIMRTILTVTLLLLSGFAVAATEASASAASPVAGSTRTSKANPPAKKPKPVDINSAGAAQLKTIPGIGADEADRIIKGRPYPTRSHLVTKNILTYEAYLAIKDKIVAIPKPMPKARR